ncbi:hypothetical protein [Thermoactinomyces sp. CICC 23799]|uniref:hypothetical protein n=1 Tax=Thermoactinomyces sp. CICC 23799 TaxID=2767429 RepID=UPI0018DD3DCB|nr:hypothetical protein [Thermoactinomyces sp. CICC 23799]MBH8601378.1 hypothetical protein [Thermoactinomyces sp. CICC 23799]
MGKKREVGSIWRAIFGDGEETPAQRDARALSRWSSGYKSKDYEKYIKPKEEARRKRWEQEEKQQSSYSSEPPDISEDEYNEKIDTAMSFFFYALGRRRW